MTLARHCADYYKKGLTVRMAFNGAVLDLCNGAVSDKFLTSISHWVQVTYRYYTVSERLMSNWGLTVLVLLLCHVGGSEGVISVSVVADSD